jgi:hypothetical protein
MMRENGAQSYCPVRFEAHCRQFAAFEPMHRSDTIATPAPAPEYQEKKHYQQGGRGSGSLKLNNNKFQGTLFCDSPPTVLLTTMMPVTSRELEAAPRIMDNPPPS